MHCTHSRAAVGSRAGLVLLRGRHVGRRSYIISRTVSPGEMVRRVDRSSASALTTGVLLNNVAGRPARALAA
jgi:hypothetical protein